MPRRTAVILSIALLAAACGAGDATTTRPSTSTSTPATTAPPGTSTTVPPPDFLLTVVPGTATRVMAGQTCLFLVTVDGGDDPVAVTAAAPHSRVEILDPSLRPGTVGEVVVVPEAGAPPGPSSVTITAERDGLVRTFSAPVEVVEWTDDLEPLAADLRDRFVAWLETERPDLGITRSTSWTGTIVQPQILVVMHYLWLSEAWEMGLLWHVTVPEHAWSRIYLRSRDELTPSFAFEIPSYPDPGAVPREIDPPDAVDR